MTESGMYTTKEVAAMLSIDYKRIHKDMKNDRIKPTDIVKGKGRGGIAYVFDADTIRSYAAKRGIYNVDFSIVGGEEDVIDEDGAIKLTPENINRIIHGENDPEPAKKTNRNADILNYFRTNYKMTNKDFAFIMNMSEKRVDNLAQGHVNLSYDNVVALCTAAKMNSFDIHPDDWYKDDPERLKRIKSWVPYKRAKLMQEYADLKAEQAGLEARMKQIEKELENK